MKHSWFPLAIYFCLVTTCTLCADQAEDEATIRKSVDAYVVAYNNRDAEKLASFWSPDAVYLNPETGDEVVGHEAIKEQFANIFAGQDDGKLSVDVQSVEFISPTVAMERGTAVVARPDTEPENTDYAAIHVKRDGKWLLDRVSEEEAPVMRSNYERLKDLDWMIGTWVDQDENSRVDMTCKWTKNQSFITRSFTASIGDRIDISGMQIIGWDPSTGKIRSWVFDSDGGFGEGTWTKKGNRWIINATATLPDGGKSSAVNTMTVLDNNSITWESSGRDLDGEILPNIGPIKVVRDATSDSE
jgi:uncharacterized protein (TIGR02246 family)